MADARRWATGLVTYWALKYLHVTCVVLSGAGFFVRGLWMLRDSPVLARRWVKVAPHVIDTLLLLSAVGLALILRQYPFEAAWITAKVFGLLAYIGLGMIALRRGRTKTIRAVFWVLALGAFAYIVSVALTRDPLGMFVAL